MIIRTHLGLGDAVYCFPIVKYFVDKGKKITVATNYPIVFNALGVRTGLINLKPDIFPKYTGRRCASSQYQTMLDSVGLPFIPFRFDWHLGFTDRFKDCCLYEFTSAFNYSRKTLCIIKEPCTAHMHKGAADYSLTPCVDQMQAWVDKFKDRFFYVSIGSEEVSRGRLENIDYNLIDKTSVQDLITLCQMSAAIVTQVGHLVPIAQGFNKPLKLFYPEKIVDRRFRHLTKETLEICGVKNQIA